MNKDNAHWHVGRRDKYEGAPRYKFQDPHLQRLYDEGYDSDPEQDINDEEQALREEFRARLNKLRATNGANLCTSCRKRPRMQGYTVCDVCY